MAGAITFTGLGSGLDTRAIIDALIGVERQPIEQLEDRRTIAQQKVSLIGSFKSLVDQLRTKAADLGNKSKLSSYAVSSSTEGYAAFSVSNTAAAGAHTLVTESLANIDRWAFDAVTDPDADLASADGETVSFTYDGTTYDVRVDQSTSSLNEIAVAINDATDGTVTASVVNTGPSSSPAWQLVLTAEESGADFRIGGLSSSIAGLTIDGTSPTGNTAGSTNNITVGSDAVAVIDGLRVQRSSNDFSDVLTGVSIQLQSADPLTTTTFTVAPDKDAIKSKIASFVSAYNLVLNFANTQNTYDQDKGEGGLLFGDSTLTRVRGILNSTLFGQTAAQVNADVNGFGTLRLVGIETNSDGTLRIDDSKLDAKVDEDLDAFLDLFVDSDGFDNGGAAVGTPAYYVDQSVDTGLGDDLARALDAAIKAYDDGAGHVYDGLFDARTDALRGEIKLYDDRIDEGNRRLDTLEEQLVARFAALESLLGGLRAQGDYLTQSLSSLNPNKS